MTTDAELLQARVDSEPDTSDDDDAAQAPPWPSTGGFLSWRADPEEGFSDWTFEFVSERIGQDGVFVSKTETVSCPKVRPWS